MEINKCLCSHSKKIHSDKVWKNDYLGRCCATWLSKETGFISMCECMDFNGVKE